MKKLLILAILIQGINFVNAQETSGFAGISVPVKTNKAVGAGIETGFLKEKVGLGFQIEYLEDKSFSTTYARVLLLWKVTENFQIKTSAGAEFTFSENYTQGHLSFGIGPNFIFNNFYLGIQPNLKVEDEKLLLSNVSFTLGMKFE